MSQFRFLVSRAFQTAQDLFWKKNAEYGTANLAGQSSILARIDDKVARLKSPTLTLDGFKDACVDLMNYAMILGLHGEDAWPRDDTRIGPLQMLVSGLADNINVPIKPGDVGFDLYAKDRVVVHPNRISFVMSGVKVKLPDGVWAMVVTRSSAWSKRGLMVIPGVIDTGYTGELGVACFSITNEVIVVEQGERLGQIVCFPSIVPPVQVVPELPQTARGESGFGSTGIGAEIAK